MLLLCLENPAHLSNPGKPGTSSSQFPWNSGETFMVTHYTWEHNFLFRNGGGSLEYRLFKRRDLLKLPLFLFQEHCI